MIKNRQDARGSSKWTKMTEAILRPHQHLYIHFTLSPYFPLNVKDHVSHPNKTGKMTLQYILIFIFYMVNRQSRVWTEWWQASPQFNLILNALYRQFLFVSFPKILTSPYFQRIYQLQLCCGFVLHSPDMNKYLVFTDKNNVPAILIKK